MAKTVQIPVGELVGENEVIDKAKVAQGTPAPAPKSDVEGQAHVKDGFCGRCNAYNRFVVSDYDYHYYRCWNCTAIFTL